MTAPATGTGGERHLVRWLVPTAAAGNAKPGLPSGVTWGYED